jgi:hypothetical protein
MLIRLTLIALLASVLCPCYAIPQDTYEIKTPVMTRTVSTGAGILKTTKMGTKSEQFLLTPSVEFMLDFDVDGKYVTAVPSNFEIKSFGATENNRIRMVEVQLDCKLVDLPITVFVRYFTHPDWPYIQKSLLVKPITTLPKARLRRVVIEDLVLRPELTATPGGVAMVNPKSGSGIYYLAGSVRGVERISRFGDLIVAEEMDVPLDSAYETGRAVIGPGSGGADALDKAFRDYISANYIRRSKQPLDPCTDITADFTDPKQFAKSVSDLQTKAAELRKSNPGCSLCLTLSRPVQPGDFHLLAVVDAIKVDLGSATPEQADRTREWLLRVFPPETLLFKP